MKGLIMGNRFGQGFEMTFVWKKTDLLVKLNENRANHRAVFEAALDGYAEEAKQILATKLAALRAGRVPNMQIMLTRPEDHTKDYDRIINALEKDVRSEFELDEVSFAQYVEDDWGWKQQWMNTSNQYAAATVTKVYGS